MPIRLRMNSRRSRFGAAANSRTPKFARPPSVSAATITISEVTTT
jgi:hypothetical protein